MENLNEYTLEELNEFLETEEYQQLDELSKKTLGSYVKKATQDVDDNAYAAGSVHADTSGRGNKTYDTTTAQAEKRKAGISKAVDKLVKESTELDSLFFQIDSGELADAKQTVTEILSNKVSDVLSTMKQQLSKSFVNESSCNAKNGDEEVDAEVEKLPKPKKAKPEVDGDGNVVEKWKPVKEESEDLDEAIVQSKNKEVGDKIDAMYAKAKANTKTVNVKDLFKKK